MAKICQCQTYYITECFSCYFGDKSMIFPCHFHCWSGGILYEESVQDRFRNLMQNPCKSDAWLMKNRSKSLTKQSWSEWSMQYPWGINEKTTIKSKNLMRNQCKFDARAVGAWFSLWCHMTMTSSWYP